MRTCQIDGCRLERVLVRVRVERSQRADVYLGSWPVERVLGQCSRGEEGVMKGFCRRGSLMRCCSEVEGVANEEREEGSREKVTGVEGCGDAAHLFS